MKPRRTHYSNSVYRLAGGTEDNDLWVQATVDSNAYPVLCSTWQPSDEERALIAAGGNVELVLWGDQHPPVAIGVVNHPLGAPPRSARQEI